MLYPSEKATIGKAVVLWPNTTTPSKLYAPSISMRADKLYTARELVRIALFTLPLLIPQTAYLISKSIAVATMKIAA